MSRTVRPRRRRGAPVAAPAHARAPGDPRARGTRGAARVLPGRPVDRRRGRGRSRLLRRPVPHPVRRAGRRRQRRRSRSPRTSIARSATGPTRTSRAGRASSRPARPGTDADGVVALVTDRGRTHPWRFPVDPATGGPAGDPSPPGARRRDGAHARRRRRPRRRSPPRSARARRSCASWTPTGELRPLTTMGSAWIDGLAWPRMRCMEVPGPGGPIETWIASPAGAADDEALPTVVDVHGGPAGGMVAGPEPGGRAAVRPRLPRGAAQHPRLLLVRRGVDHAAARRLGRPRRRGRARGAGPRRAARPGGPGAAGGAGPLVRRVHGQLARRARRTGSGRPCPRTA